MTYEQENKNVKFGWLGGTTRYLSSFPMPKPGIFEKEEKNVAELLDKVEESKSWNVGDTAVSPQLKRNIFNRRMINLYFTAGSVD